MWEFRKQTNKKQNKHWAYGKSLKGGIKPLVKGLPTPVSCNRGTRHALSSDLSSKRKKNMHITHLYRFTNKGGRLTGLFLVFLFFFKKGDVSSVTILIQTEMEDSFSLEYFRVFQSPFP